GPVGERVFYIQGRQKGRLVTLKSEKEQVRALATYLAQILDKLPTASEPTPQSLDLVEPVDAAWPVASLGLGWDEKRQRIVVVAESVVDEEGEEPATARFAITRAQAAAFVERTESLVGAGRPICPLCSQPRDPAGHVCPRSHGHVVTAWRRRAPRARRGDPQGAAAPQHERDLPRRGRARGHLRARPA